MDKKPDVGLGKPRCYYFQSGRCSKKDCFFIHDHRTTARPPVCSFWEQGKCTFENNCVYFHDDGNDKDVRGSLDRIPKPGQAAAASATRAGTTRRSDARSWRKDATDEDGWITKQPRKHKPAPPTLPTPPPQPPREDAWTD